MLCHVATLGADTDPARIHASQEMHVWIAPQADTCIEAGALHVGISCDVVKM